MEAEEDLSLSDPEDDIFEGVAEIGQGTLQPLAPVPPDPTTSSSKAKPPTPSASGSPQLASASTADSHDKPPADSHQPGHVPAAVTRVISSTSGVVSGVDPVDKLSRVGASDEQTRAKAGDIGDDEWSRMLQAEKAAREAAEAEAAAAVAARRKAEEATRVAHDETERLRGLMRKLDEEKKKAEAAAEKLAGEKAAVETAKGEMLTRLRGIVEEAMKRKREADEGKASAEVAAAEANKQREKAVSEKEGLKKERDGALRERDIAKSASNSAMRSRDEAIRDRDTAVKAKEAAVRAKDSAEKVRAEALEAAEKMRKERDAAMADTANVARDMDQLVERIRREEQRLGPLIGISDPDRPREGSSTAGTASTASGVSGHENKSDTAASVASSLHKKQQELVGSVGADLQSNAGREVAGAVQVMLQLVEAAAVAIGRVREEVEEREMACAMQVCVALTVWVCKCSIGSLKWANVDLQFRLLPCARPMKCHCMFHWPIERVLRCITIVTKRSLLGDVHTPPAFILVGVPAGGKSRRNREQAGQQPIGARQVEGSHGRHGAAAAGDRAHG